MAKLSPTFVVLGIIEAESTSHGYRLLKHFRSPDRLGSVWKLNTSQLYSILKRLERDELLDGQEVSAPDAPIRTEYWVTDAGQQAFYDWLEDPEPSASTRNIRTEFLSRMYLARLLDRPTDAIVKAQKNACMAYMDKLNMLTEEKQGMASLNIELLLAEMQAVLNWLDEACEDTYLNVNMLEAETT